MENKIIELENRIKKLETILENIEFSGDGLNITFNRTPLNSVEISGDGANVRQGTVLCLLLPRLSSILIKTSKKT